MFITFIYLDVSQECVLTKTRLVIEFLTVWMVVMKNFVYIGNLYVHKNITNSIQGITFNRL